MIVGHQEYSQFVDAHSPEPHERLPGPVVDGFVLAREKLLGRDDPLDLGCFGVAPRGTPFATVHPTLSRANVWWGRAARNYDRPWAVLRAIPFAAVRLRGTVTDGRSTDAVAA